MIPHLKTFMICNHVARTSPSNYMDLVHFLLFGIRNCSTLTNWFKLSRSHYLMQTIMDFIICVVSYVVHQIIIYLCHQTEEPTLDTPPSSNKATSSGPQYSRSSPPPSGRLILETYAKRFQHAGRTTQIVGKFLRKSSKLFIKKLLKRHYFCIFFKRFYQTIRCFFERLEEKTQIVGKF